MITMIIRTGDMKQHKKSSHQLLFFTYP